MDFAEDLAWGGSVISLDVRAKLAMFPTLHLKRHYDKAYACVQLTTLATFTPTKTLS